MSKLLETKGIQSTISDSSQSEFGSGDVVAPGIYIDVETGAVVKMNEPDELPEGLRVVQYRRRFRRLQNHATANN